jgi:hypothetical protein
MMSTTNKGEQELQSAPAGMAEPRPMEEGVKADTLIWRRSTPSHCWSAPVPAFALEGEVAAEVRLFTSAMVWIWREKNRGTFRTRMNTTAFTISHRQAPTESRLNTMSLHADTVETSAQLCVSVCEGGMYARKHDPRPAPSTRR